MVRLIAPLEGFVKDRRLGDVLGSNLLEVEHSIGQRASGVGYRLGSRAGPARWPGNDGTNRARAQSSSA